jgi:hypothetical protein
MNERIKLVFQHKAALPSVTALVGVGVGAAIGYYFTKAQYDKIEQDLETLQSNQQEFDFATAELTDNLHRTLREANFSADKLKKAAELFSGWMDEKIDNKIAEEIGLDEEGAAALRADHPSAVSKDQELLRSKVVSRLTLVEQDPGDHHIEVTGVTTNVFDNPDDDWDYKTELESRGNVQPYIIHVDEFVGNENEWSQSTLTYYEGDDILTDSHDKPLYDASEIVGQNLRFGHGSKDPNVVYIRNPRLEMEMEILRDPSSYEKEVLGETIEKRAQTADLKHSHQRRFRPD